MNDRGEGGQKLMEEMAMKYFQSKAPGLYEKSLLLKRKGHDLGERYPDQFASRATAIMQPFMQQLKANDAYDRGRRFVLPVIQSGILNGVIPIGEEESQAYQFAKKHVTTWLQHSLANPQEQAQETQDINKIPYSIRSAANPPRPTRDPRLNSGSFNPDGYAQGDQMEHNPRTVQLSMEHNPSFYAGSGFHPLRTLNPFDWAIGSHMEHNPSFQPLRTLNPFDWAIGSHMEHNPVFGGKYANTEDFIHKQEAYNTLYGEPSHAGRDMLIGAGGLAAGYGAYKWWQHNRKKKKELEMEHNPGFPSIPNLPRIGAPQTWKNKRTGEQKTVSGGTYQPWLYSGDWEQMEHNPIPIRGETLRVGERWLGRRVNEPQHMEHNIIPLLLGLGLAASAGWIGHNIYSDWAQRALLRASGRQEHNPINEEMIKRGHAGMSNFYGREF